MDSCCQFVFIPSLFSSHIACLPLLDAQFLRLAQLFVATDYDAVARLKARDHLALARILASELYLHLSRRPSVGGEAVNPSAPSQLEEVATRNDEGFLRPSQSYLHAVALAKADVGNRMTRLNLTKSRLTEQKTNFQNLKSQNEDIDLEEVIVGYSSAQLVYNASLTAASKVVQQTLLDFL